MKSLAIRLIAWDHRATTRLEGRPVALLPVMRLITHIGGIIFTTLLTLGLVILLRRQGDTFHSNLFLGVAVQMVVFGGLIKYVWRRKRPDTEYARNMFFASYSFPSAHALDSVLLYGTLAYYLCLRANLWQTLLYILGSAGLVAAIAYSRIYLGAHYILDVLAGLLLGSTLLLTAIFFIQQ